MGNVSSDDEDTHRCFPVSVQEIVHPADLANYRTLFQSIEDSQMIQKQDVASTVSKTIAEYAAGVVKECSNPKCSEKVILLHQDLVDGTWERAQPEFGTIPLYYTTSEDSQYYRGRAAEVLSIAAIECWCFDCMRDTWKCECGLYKLDIDDVTSFCCNVPTALLEDGAVNYCERSMVQCVPECVHTWSHISHCDICGNICCKKHTAHCDQCEKTLCFDCEFVDQLHGRYVNPCVTLLVCDRCGTKTVKDHKGTCVEDRATSFCGIVQFCKVKDCDQFTCPWCDDSSWLCAAHRAICDNPKESKRLKRSNDSMKKCEYCGVRKEKMLRCGQCKSVHYCSKKCQRPHWKKHKKTCKKRMKE